MTALYLDGAGLSEEATLETLWMERKLPCEGLGNSALSKRGSKYKHPTAEMCFCPRSGMKAIVAGAT